MFDPRLFDPRRKYHNIQHISRMLNVLFSIQGKSIWTAKYDVFHTLTPDEIEDLYYAILWHDVVYDPAAPEGENERLSAEQWSLYAKWCLGFRPERIKDVYNLIQSTAYHFKKVPSQWLHSNRLVTGIFLDIDLETFRYGFHEFCSYSWAIVQEAKEFGFDIEVAAANQRKFLASIPKDRGVYYTDLFGRSGDSKAKSNISQFLKENKE